MCIFAYNYMGDKLGAIECSRGLGSILGIEFAPCFALLFRQRQKISRVVIPAGCFPTSTEPGSALSAMLGIADLHCTLHVHVTFQQSHADDDGRKEKSV